MTLERLNRLTFYSPASHAGGPNERRGARPGLRAAGAGPGSGGGGMPRPGAGAGQGHPSGVELRGSWAHGLRKIDAAPLGVGAVDIFS